MILKAAGEGERLRIGERRSGEIVNADYVQRATGARLDDNALILHILIEGGTISKEKALEAICGVVELASVGERLSSRLKGVPNHAELDEHVEDLRDRGGSTCWLPHLCPRNRSSEADDSTRTCLCSG